jgi:hypothetical protein
MEAAPLDRVLLADLEHLLATGACQVHRAEAYYGHLVLRPMGCLVLFYTSRLVGKGG